MADKLTILLVDDEPDLIEILEDYFAEKFKVRSTSDPKQALQWISCETFDCVFTDLKMPQVSGFEIIEATVKRAPHTLVFAASGHGVTGKSGLKAIAMGATKLFNKPYGNLDELCQEIHGLAAARLAKSA